MQLRARFGAMRRSKLAELAEGQLGRVIGRVRPLEDQLPLTSGLTGRTGVYIRSIIEVHAGWVRGWQPLIDELRMVAFAIQDGTARAAIDLTDAEVDLPEIDIPSHHPRALAYLAVHGLAYRAREPLRFRETLLGLDELVSLLGIGVREPDPLAPPPSDYRGDPVTRLRFGSSPDHRLLISADADAVLAP